MPFIKGSENMISQGEENEFPNEFNAEEIKEHMNKEEKYSKIEEESVILFYLTKILV